MVLLTFPPGPYVRGPSFPIRELDTKTAISRNKRSGVEFAGAASGGVVGSWKATVIGLLRSMLTVIYTFIFWSVLRRIPAETAHRVSFGALRAITKIPGVRWAIRRVCLVRDPRLRVTALGREFANPIGLAAGFDKDATGPHALAALGFGFIEIGTLTAQPQPGNPRPRMFRLTGDRALINRMGFNNHGAAAAARRLAGNIPGEGLPIGVNIGKTKVVAEADAVADYVASTRHLAPVADYLVVNVSSPNTPGLRDLQAVSQLRPLLTAVRDTLAELALPTPPPLLVKIAPDLADEDVDAVADLAIELALDGIIVTNTTISREGLRTPAERVAKIGAGGLSGAPLKERSLAVLRRVADRAAGLTIISVGGIETAEEAWERLASGATLVQGYTGLIYGGPLWVRRLQRGLLAQLDRAGLRTIGEANGHRGARTSG